MFRKNKKKKEPETESIAIGPEEMPDDIEDDTDVETLKRKQKELEEAIALTKAKKVVTPKSEPEIPEETKSTETEELEEPGEESNEEEQVEELTEEKVRVAFTDLYQRVQNLEAFAFRHRGI